MEKDKINDHFIRFPYRKEVRDDGNINNGGIDLIENPERIGEIHEISDVTWLKRFVSEINAPGGHFMTFGCDYGPLDNYYAGYIDFSHRPSMRHSDTNDLRIIDEHFLAWISELYQDDISEPNPIEYSRAMLHWEYSDLEYQGIYEKVSLWFRAQAPDGCKWLLDHVRYFLVNVYPSLPHVKSALKKPAE